MKRLIIIILIFGIGCTSKTVRVEDLNSWTGQDIIILEKHPLFSAFPREERTLYNKQILINFTEKKSISKDPSGCVNTGISRYNDGFGLGLGTQFCGDREIIEENCVHQFVTEGERVVSYNVLGKNCYTTCSHQPDPRKCNKE